MNVIVKRPFDYSTNGITACALAVGDKLHIGNSMLKGLIAEGFVALDVAPAIAPTSKVPPPKTAATPAQVPKPRTR